MKIKAPILTYIQPKSFTECYQIQEFKDAWIKDPKPKGHLNGLTLDGCCFENVSFQEMDMERIDMIDVIFDHCDFSNQSLRGIYLQRVVFRNCKLTGTDFTGSTMKNVLFEHCQARYINMAECQLEMCQLQESDFQESTFFLARIKKTEFKQLSLQMGELTQVNHDALDLSTCQIDGVTIDQQTLKGLTVNSFQALDLIGILGVKIKDGR